MRNGRQRRESTRVQDLIHEILAATRHLISDAVCQSLGGTINELLHGALRTLLYYMAAGSCFVVSVVLLLLGCVYGLKMLSLPDAVVYALIGILGIGAGMLIVKYAGSRGASTPQKRWRS